MQATPSRLSLESLPPEIAKQITLELQLPDLIELLRVSAQIRSLFWCPQSDVDFARRHLLRVLPPDPKRFFVSNRGNLHIGGPDQDKIDALGRLHFQTLPLAYSVALFQLVGFNGESISFVIKDTIEFHFPLKFKHQEEQPDQLSSGTMDGFRLNPIVDDVEDSTAVLLSKCAALMDSPDLVTMIIDRFCSQQPEPSGDESMLDSLAGKADVRRPRLVNLLAEEACKRGSVNVLELVLGMHASPTLLHDIAAECIRGDTRTLSVSCLIVKSLRIPEWIP
ncbi:hypothetical protein HDU96_002598 [Phlyctochytrium bullatum]|nr:hypothetical protein HDU96_002598 [Phlyctochytrium bullatum]